MSTQIATTWIDSTTGNPLTVPTSDPEHRVIDNLGNVLIAAGTAMTEIGTGAWFSTAFTAVAGRTYYYEFDGDPNGDNAGIVTGDRWQRCSRTGDEILLAAAVADIQSRLPATLNGGRMRSHVEDVDTDAIDADALATDVVNEIRDSILSDATPFAGANVDAAISSRESEASASTRATTNQTEHDATQADIAALNDLAIADVQTALTNQGYTAARAPNLDNLDAAVSTRAAPGDAMALTAAERTALAGVIDTTLGGSHGVGSWATAVGFSTHSAADVDTVLTASHGAGSWVGAGLTATQATQLEETWQMRGLDLANPAELRKAIVGTPGYIRIPLAGTTIDVEVTQVDANTVRLQRQ